MLCLFSHIATAQSGLPSSPPDTPRAMCMVQLPDPASPPAFAIPPNPGPGSLSTCGSGRLVAYFEDVDMTTGLGFDDPSLGASRRSCVCSVLAYLESVLDIHADITATNPLYIKFDAYSTTTFAYPNNLLASLVTPNYVVNSPGFHHSFMGNAVINGVPNVGLEDCGDININFAISFNYCGSTIGGCEDDFFSLVLHDITHLLGFTSALERPALASPSTVISGLGTSTFTEFDHHFLYYDNGTPPLTKIVDNTTLSLAVAGTTLAAAQYDIWLTGDDVTTSRLNQPILDGSYGPACWRARQHPA